MVDENGSEARTGMKITYREGSNAEAMVEVGDPTSINEKEAEDLMKQESQSERQDAEEAQQKGISRVSQSAAVIWVSQYRMNAIEL